MVKLAKLVLLEVYLLQGLEEEARALGQDKQVKALLKYPMGNYQVIALSTTSELRKIARL